MCKQRKMAARLYSPVYWTIVLLYCWYKITQEVNTMKHANQKIIPISEAYRRPYPNAAEPRYYLNRLLDAALSVATGMGCVTVFFFLITM